MKVVGITGPEMQIEKFAVGEYIIIHTTTEEMETYDIATAGLTNHRWIMREIVVNGELISRQYRYIGYTYDFATKKWYLDR